MSKVGAPPRARRSPRCKTCRHRKVKCDYVSPVCGPCKKSKLQCEPYEASFIFVAVDPPSTTPPSHEQLVLRPTSSKTLPSAKDLANCPLLAGSLKRSNIFDQFLRFYFPSNPALLESSSYSWVATISENKETFLLLDTTACALGTLFLSRKNEDLNLKHESMTLYGDALSHARALWDTADKTNWFRPLLGVSLLLLYESLSPSSLASTKKTLNHGMGLATLLQLAGPKSFQTAAPHILFIHARVALLYIAILEEKPSFLAERDWLEQPWVRVAKNNMHASLDTLSQVPELLSLSNQICEAAQTHTEYSRLMEQFDLQHDKVLILIKQTGECLQNTGEKPKNLHEFTATQNRLACQLMVFDALERLSSLSHIAAFQRYRQSANSSKPTAESAADAIIFSINHFNTDECGFIGLRLLFVAARAAVQFLQRQCRAQEAAVTKLLETFKSKGFYFLLDVL
ncbi:hypothetical protein VHEMI09284 [[Torrubiella] hemipterigena]|uniref:Zn(2)-C6 fungal-type domain-containing protein n=1 Tax=[Torrubiella] hemipterigena TaxID=1531966 RepID=A0A0A1TRA1_9HYPO|nr:hypothetical protein VHEMI09284 [[Torrubiella] hemipterigena]